MTSTTTTIFTNNRSQAVRLPKNVAFGEEVKKVKIITLGRGRLIVPEADIWSSWFDAEGVTDDFMAEREQPTAQERETL